MPAPTNISAATAIDITSLPYSLTQDNAFGGTTYTVWWKRTIAAGETVDSIFGLGSADLSTYRPTVFLYRNDPAGAAFTSYQNRPVYFPTVEGDTWYFKFVSNAGNPSPAPLTVSLQTHQDQSAPAGSIAIIDTRTGYPIAILDAEVDYSVLRYVLNTTNTEYGAGILPSGIFAVGHGTEVILYDSNYTNIAFTDTLATDSIANVTTNNTNAFYASTGNPFAIDPAQVFKIADDGTLDATSWILPEIEVNGICVSPDETILYYTTNIANEPVRRWDLVNDVALSNLAAGINANTVAIRNCLCLDDGTVLVGYRNSTAHTEFVRQYSAAGATLNTYSLDYSVSDAEDVLARDVTDANFWVWQHDGVGATNATPFFRQIRISDGSVLQSRPLVAFDAGRYLYSETLTPTARFGGSYSCPFWITRTGASTPPDNELNGPGGLDILRARGDLVTYPIRRVRITPHTFDKNQNIRFDRLELFMAGGQGTVTGQGSTPTIELHCSNDGGETYPIIRTLNAGKLGAYRTRAYTWQLGTTRDRVWKFIQTDPVNTIWLGVDILLRELLN